MNLIEKFVNSYDNKRTKDCYRNHLLTYFKVIKADPDNYIKKNKDYTEDLTKWWDYNREKTPLTRSQRMSCVKIFLDDNDAEIPNKIWKRFKRKQKSVKPVTIDRIPTNQELKRILEHGEVKAKALFLIASSSGMRIDEILGLEEDDIDFKTDPIKIYVRSEIAKFGKSRVTYMSQEAKNSLDEWFKVRKAYFEKALKIANRKNNPITSKKLNDPTIFCFTYQTAINVWHRLLRDAGLDQRDRTTNFYRLHIHTLRKFFKTRMLNAGIQTEIVNKLIGQEGYLDNSYVRFTEKEIATAYKQGVKSLYVFETTPDLTETTIEISNLKSDNEKLRDDLAEMKAQITEMRLERIERINGIKKEK